MSDSGRYEVRIETDARKYLSALDQSNRERISKKIYELANNPRPVGYKS
jgi:mRNA-degrading endonuclease RelE of RelBE toxin-antitoxin system